VSARTRLWDDAERVRHRMEFPETAPPEPEMEILPPSTPLHLRSPCRLHPLVRSSA